MGCFQNYLINEASKAGSGITDSQDNKSLQTKTKIKITKFKSRNKAKKL